MATRHFPTYNGETLSWDIDLYNSRAEEREGFPRARAVIAAMRQHRPEQLRAEHQAYLKASFDRMFGQNARKMLRLIEETHP